MDPLSQAIERAGGISSLAQMIGCTASAPSMWKSRGRVPIDWCPSIEKATGVRCEALRPDWEWAYLRGTSPEIPQSAVPQQHEVA